MKFMWTFPVINMEYLFRCGWNYSFNISVRFIEKSDLSIQIEQRQNTTDRFLSKFRISVLIRIYTYIETSPNRLFGWNNNFIFQTDVLVKIRNACDYGNFSPISAVFCRFYPHSLLFRFHSNFPSIFHNGCYFTVWQKVQSFT